MDVFKYPIILIAICFGLGIIVQNYLCFSLITILSISSILLIIFIILYIKGKNYQKPFFGIVTYLLCFSLGGISLYIHQDINSNTHYSNQKFDNNNIIEGIVLEELKPNEFYYKFIIKVMICNSKKSSGKILVYFSKKNKERIQIGDMILINSRLNPILKNYNPNTFDYAKYLENQNVFYQIQCFENDYFIKNKIKNINFYIYTLRQKLVHSFDLHYFSNKTKSIINALLLGQKQHIDNATLTDYKNSGVVHILAISGLHIGIIYGFLNFIFGFMSRIKHGKTIKLLFILLILWLFALISGMSASITRAVLMFSLIAYGNFLNRRNSVYNAVAASFFILLIYNPQFIFDVGFQLSYVAVVSILLFQPFFKKYYLSKNKILIYITDLFLVSIAAQIGVLPLMILYFKQIPTLFLVANLVVIPIATVVLILGIITLVLNFIYLPLALILGKTISFLVEYMNKYIHFLSSFSNYVIKNITFTPLLALFLYLIILSFVYWVYKPKNSRLLMVLTFVFSFQLLYFFTKQNVTHLQEMIVFNNKESVISVFDSNEIKVFTNDSLISMNTSFQEYKTAKFNPKTNILPLENLIFFKNKKILIVDESCIYDTSIKPDVVIIRQNARINIERLIQTTKPSIIIADKSNSFTSVKRWKAICLKYKIPFHAIAEKGFYRMD